MGNVRFTVGAVQQIMQGKTHHARIAVLPRDHAEAAVQQSGAMPGMAHPAYLSVADSNCL